MGRFLPWRSVTFSKLGRGAGSCLVSLVYMAPFSAPFGGFCPRLGSLCKGLRGGVRLAFRSTGGPIYRQHLRRLRRTLVETTDTPSGDTILVDPPVCRTGTPGALLRASRDEGPVRNPAPLPVSPEGDHFPRARCMRFCVCPSCPAPAPPRRHACRCIRERNGGIMGTG